MKQIVTILAAIAISLPTFAQRPADALVPDKQQWISRYVPAQWGRLSYGSFNMEPAELLGKLEAFKKAAYDSIAGGKDPMQYQLKKKDIDAYARLLLLSYAGNYGLDSTKEAAFYAAAQTEKPGDSLSQQQLQQLYNARITRQLPTATRDSLVALALDGWELSDSALFLNSHAFRQLVAQKLDNILENRYHQAPNGQPQEVLIRQQMLNDMLPKGYVYEYLSYENIENAITREVDSVTQAKAYQLYMASAADTANRKKIAEAYHNALTYVNNSPAPDFAFPDINGKTVSLRQLRGKYVYIDVWATWCGPCKGEIPHLGKLEAALHGKNIRFVSISVDKQKDKMAWQKFVKEKHLQGIQLMVNKDTDEPFTRKLNINSIPRFILIDPDGKLVDANALRPSNPDLKKQLEQLL